MIQISDSNETIEILEAIYMTWFTLEFVVRFISCPDRCKFYFSYHHHHLHNYNYDYIIVIIIIAIIIVLIITIIIIIIIVIVIVIIPTKGGCEREAGEQWCKLQERGDEENDEHA